MRLPIPAAGIIRVNDGDSTSLPAIYRISIASPNEKNL